MPSDSKHTKTYFTKATMKPYQTLLLSLLLLSFATTTQAETITLRTLPLYFWPIANDDGTCTENLEKFKTAASADFSAAEQLFDISTANNNYDIHISEPSDTLTKIEALENSTLTQIDPNNICDALFEKAQNRGTDNFEGNILDDIHNGRLYINQNGQQIKISDYLIANNYDLGYLILPGLVRSVDNSNQFQRLGAAFHTTTDVNHTSARKRMMALGTLDANNVGFTTAHEIGHLLGLDHDRINPIHPLGSLLFNYTSDH